MRCDDDHVMTAATMQQSTIRRCCEGVKTVSKVLELIGPVAIALRFGCSRSRVVRLDGVDCRSSLIGAWWFLGGERKALDVDRWLARMFVPHDRDFNFVTPSQWIFLDFFGRKKEQEGRIERDLFFMISTWKYHLHLLI